MIKVVMCNNLVNMQINKQLIQASEQATRHAWKHLNETDIIVDRKLVLRERAAAAASALTGCVYGSSNRDNISNRMAYS